MKNLMLDSLSRNDEIERERARLGRIGPRPRGPMCGREPTDYFVPPRVPGFGAKARRTAAGAAALPKKSTASFWLSLVMCMTLFAGCSSVKPAPKQSAAVITPSVQPQPYVPHNSLWNKFVRGWLNGDAPPPDYKEEDKTGIAACLGVAYWASIAGWLLAGGGR